MKKIEQAYSADPSIYFSLFCVSSSVILWEVLLTRIYSVIMFYHYAFMAVSIAMFGLATGALIVFFSPQSHDATKQKELLGLMGLLTGIFMAVSIAIQLQLQPVMDDSVKTTFYLAQIYIFSTIPIIPAGAAICIALTKYKNVGSLYFADLAGAAAGCLFIPFLLRWLGGPGAVIATAAIACTGSFTQFPRYSRMRLVSFAISVGFLVFAVANRSLRWLEINSTHMENSEVNLYESWNSFSRIVVKPYSSKFASPGIHPSNLEHLQPIEQKVLIIDSSASTVLTKFEGNLDALNVLRLDQSTLSHQLRPQSNVLIIGPGGGRDILGALVMGQRNIRAVEINPNILDAVNNSFGDFTGYLNRLPNVHFSVEDGRSYLAHTNEKFDVIQASLVDTVAATAAGAYAFTENGLYTIEAWKLFIHRLNPRGILSFSRWYYGSTTWPVEIYRTIALAAAALRSVGVSDPETHIVVVQAMNVGRPGMTKISEGLATVLVSPDPFSDKDIKNLQALCTKMMCTLAWPSNPSVDPQIKAIIDANPEALRTVLPLDISPPTDNRPFFFFHTRLKDILLNRNVRRFGFSSFNLPAVRNLLSLLFISIAMGTVLIALPVVFKNPEWKETVGASRFLSPIYFSSIGIGFMFFEIGLIQRLSLFLGHPTYGFTVVLAGILLLTGLGSLSSDVVTREMKRSSWIFIALIITLILAERASAFALQRNLGATVFDRIVLALFIISPPAFFMGFAFPIGMELARRHQDKRTNWYWAINGSFSVISSVLAVVISIGMGIQVTFIASTIFYGIAGLVSFLLSTY